MDSEYLALRLGILEDKQAKQEEKINAMYTSGALQNQQITTIMSLLTEIKTDVNSLKSEKSEAMQGNKKTFVNTIIQVVTTIFTTAAIGAIVAAVVSNPR